MTYFLLFAILVFVVFGLLTKGSGRTYAFLTAAMIALFMLLFFGFVLGAIPQALG